MILGTICWDNITLRLANTTLDDVLEYSGNNPLVVPVKSFWLAIKPEVRNGLQYPVEQTESQPIVKQVQNFKKRRRCRKKNSTDE